MSDSFAHIEKQEMARRLRKGVELAKKNESQFNMSWWIRDKYGSVSGAVDNLPHVAEMSECGTMCCYAGWLTQAGREEGKQASLKMWDLCRASYMYLFNISEEEYITIRIKGTRHAVQNVTILRAENAVSALFAIGTWEKFVDTFRSDISTLELLEEVVEKFIEHYGLMTPGTIDQIWGYPGTERGQEWVDGVSWM